jgi:hypothetical protein
MIPQSNLSQRHRDAENFDPFAGSTAFIPSIPLSRPQTSSVPPCLCEKKPEAGQ